MLSHHDTAIASRNAVGIHECGKRSTAADITISWVLAGFSSEQELGLVSGDLRDGGEDVRTVDGRSFHAVAMINASITRLTIQRKLLTHTQPGPAGYITTAILCHSNMQLHA